MVYLSKNVVGKCRILVCVNIFLGTKTRGVLYLERVINLEWNTVFGIYFCFPASDSRLFPMFLFCLCRFSNIYLLPRTEAAWIFDYHYYTEGQRELKLMKLFMYTNISSSNKPSLLSKQTQSIIARHSLM